MNVNGLNGLGFQLISYIKTPNGVVIRIEASEELSLEMSKRKNILNAGIAKIELKVSHLDPETNKSPPSDKVAAEEEKSQMAEKQS